MSVRVHPKLLEAALWRANPPRTAGDYRPYANCFRQGAINIFRQLFIPDWRRQIELTIYDAHSHAASIRSLTQLQNCRP